jgi:hypothetical protein
MFHPVTLGLLALGKYLQGKAQPQSPAVSASAHCVICRRKTTVVTNCCKRPLCALHLEMWKADPDPCPCRDL